MKKMPSEDHRLLVNKIDYEDVFHPNWTDHNGNDMEQMLAGIALHLVEVYNSAQLDSVYPVGSIYMSTSPTNPRTLIGGMWERIQGRFLIGASSEYTAGSTGGSTSAEVDIDVDTGGGLASHTHGFSYSSASSVDTQRLRYVGWDDDYLGGLQVQGIDCYTTYVPSKTSSGTISLNTSTRSSTTNSAGSGSGGGSGSGSDTVRIVPPYLAVYMWERIE